MPLEPPREGVFESLQSAEEEIASVAISQGYAAARLRSKKSKLREIRKVWLCCAHGRKPKASELLRSRRTSTRCTGCPWRVTIERGEDGWTVRIICPEHNHTPSVNPVAYPSARRLTDAKRNLVCELSRVGARPRVIVAAIRAQRVGVTVLSQDVYNERRRAREVALRGRTPIEVLLDDLRENDIFHDVQVDGRNQVTHLFFALAQGIELAQQHNQVVLMDSTYKTNRFKLPLLHVVGVSATNMTFSICFCFMQSEHEVDYVWALARAKRCFLQERVPGVVITDRELALMSAVRLVLPSATNLLCTWHIEKNILSNVKRNFATEECFRALMRDWNELVSSIDVESFECQWTRFQARYNSAGPTTACLASTWIVHKEKFVLAWTKQVLHFGHLVTSRVEGNHSMLKSWIATSTRDLGGVVDRIKLAIENQVREIRGRVAFERVNVLFECTGTLWARVQRKVSYQALKMVALQIEKTTKRLRDRAELPPCSGVFTSTLGLPCSHRLREFVVGGRQQQLVDFNEQWHLEKPVIDIGVVCERSRHRLDAMLDDVEMFHGALRPHQQQQSEQRITQVIDSFETHVRDPGRAHTRGRPSLSAGTTRRDPSAFECIRDGAARRCGRCHCPGHNRRTCLAQLSAAESLK